MTDKEKLIEILRVPIYPHLDADPAEVVADYLLDNGVTVQQWIPVSERLPRAEDANSFDEVMVWLRSTETQALWTRRLVMDHPEAISHWMPLPERPKEVE
jgi:hypothetical protein